MEKFLLLGAALHGLLAVSFGAFGAHGLKARVAALDPAEAAKVLGWVETASKYQLAHAVALLALAGLTARLAPSPAWVAGHGFFWGSLVFSGTLYAMALGAPRWLGAVTPLGGLGLIVGWAALLWAGMKD
jgi:uncharacterized membrane protein YgdD (TMEM256/DUF423 family)